MGFLEKEEKKKRRRRKEKETLQKITKITNKDFKQMIPIDDELPPDTLEEVLVWGTHCGFSLGVASVIKQHHNYDKRTLGYFRITHWFPLSRI